MLGFFPLLVPLLLAGPAPGPPPLVRYELVETRRWITPQGEEVRALGGTVEVRGDAARWELRNKGHFPRSVATQAFFTDRETFLVDPVGKVAARTSPGAIRDLFLAPAPADPGPFASAVKDLVATVNESGAGKPFGDLPTVRYSVKLEFVLTSMAPGRVSRIKTVLEGSIDALPDRPELRSPVDDLVRLFDYPEAVREALQPQLEHVAGLPVAVSLRTRSELGVEYPQDWEGGSAPPFRPVVTTTEVTRTVSDLSVRAGKAEDGKRFGVPEDYRSVGVERLVEAPPRLP